MANKSHFPSLKGQLIVREASGKIKQIHNIKENLGEAKIIATIREQDGTLVSKQDIAFGSFVDNFPKMLLANFEELGSGAAVLMKATDASTAYAKSVVVTNAANDSTHGIIVGKNDNTTGYISSSSASLVSGANYALRFQIAEGTGTDQLTHGACTMDYTFGTGTLDFTRTFTNDGTASITVKEIGIAGAIGGKNYLLVRDIHESVSFPYESAGTSANISLSVGAAQVLTITYSFGISDTDGMVDGWLGVMASLMSGAAANTGTIDLPALGGGATSSAIASVDFVANPTYTDWKGASTAKNQGFVIGTDESYTNRAEWYMADLDNTVDYELQTTGEITTGSLDVSNTVGDWKIYETYIGASRIFRNSSGSLITLYEGGIVLEGSATTARVPIIRFKFASQNGVVLNDAESVQMILKIAFVQDAESR